MRRWSGFESKWNNIEDLQESRHQMYTAKRKTKKLPRGRHQKKRGRLRKSWSNYTQSSCTWSFKMTMLPLQPIHTIPSTRQLRHVREPVQTCTEHRRDVYMIPRNHELIRQWLKKDDHVSSWHVTFMCSYVIITILAVLSLWMIMVAIVLSSVDSNIFISW